MTISDLKQQADTLAASVHEAWRYLKVDEKIEARNVLEGQMSAPGFWDDPKKAEVVGKRFGAMDREVKAWSTLRDDVDAVTGLLDEVDDDDADMIAEMVSTIEASQIVFSELERAKLFSGDYDEHAAIISFHAGAGGVDAQDFTEMLLRMYLRFFEKMEWDATVLTETRGTEAGIKSATIRVEGLRAYGHLRAEAGVHRLVRLSPFNADALRQTSFALVDVVPEIEDDGTFDIDQNELRIDTFMAGGNGGQGVNTTYSAVRIVHEPTGIMVQCQNERSQTQNKEFAMKVLRGKLLQRKLQEQRSELASIRGDVSSAEWGNQIRSYVLHPYQMVKDHRTNHETSDTTGVLDGDLLIFIDTRLKQLAELGA